ncbi:MAG: hypothetical protein CME71_06655 [Halobacteriovorax sp.]|nr:hypothetical protein [Halobacteriovorax sp.]
MKFLSTLIFASFLVTSLSAKELASKVHKLNWDGLEVVWVEDDRFPTYDLSVYFADGALSDNPNRKGESQAALGLLTTGTNRYKQKELVDHLEFFGVSHGPYVTHEYSLYNVSGLVKDSIPTFKRLCHMFTDATYPKREVDREIKRAKDALTNMVSDPGSLASRAFRELSLAGTPYAYPVEGKLRDLSRLSPGHLKDKLEYFNQKVAKRVYVTGPKQILKIKEILNNECGWKGKDASFKREITFTKEFSSKDPEIFLVSVPGSNQAQVRIGRFLSEELVQPREAVELLSTYLGGGFTSLLMRELRSSRGLVYSAGAFAAGQKSYGRAAIQTSTKNESAAALLGVVKELLVELKEGKIRDNIFAISKGRLMGSYPFRFEKSSDFLQQLIYLDHVGVNYQRFLDFPDYLSKVDEAEMAKWGGQIFDWNKQTIVILGDKSLAKKLSEFGKVTVVGYKDFL